MILIVKRTIETAVDLGKIHLTPEVGGADGCRNVTILATIDEGYAGSSIDKILPACRRFLRGQRSAIVYIIGTKSGAIVVKL